MNANKRHSEDSKTQMDFEKFRSVKISVIGQPSLASTTFIGTFVPYTRPHQTDISSDMVSIKTTIFERDSEKIDLGFIEMETQPFFAPFRKEMYSESHIIVLVLEKSLNFIKDFRRLAEETHELERSMNPKRVFILIDVSLLGEQAGQQSRDFGVEFVQ